MTSTNTKNYPALDAAIVAAKEKERRIKSLFMTYFDGCYDTDPMPGTANTFHMGVCKLEYNAVDNCLVVHLRRPGLLIGKGGKTVDDLAKYLECGIEIKEIDLMK